MPVQTAAEAADPSGVRVAGVDKYFSPRLPELDGLRGLAILLVIVWHYFVLRLEFVPGSLPAYLTATLRLGWSGVDLFFVLSGFLIGGILMDNRLSENYFKAFYVRRICRIFPLYFLWFLLFCVFLLAAGPPLQATLAWLFGRPQPLWSYATFTQNFTMAYSNFGGANWMGITWSLAVEEQFYCVLPFIVRYVAPRRLPWLLVGFIVLAPLLRVFLSFSFSAGPTAAYILMPCRADALLLGALCAWMVRQREIAAWLATHTNILYIAFAILLAGTGLISVKYDPFLSDGWRNMNYTWLAFLYACLLMLAVTEKNGPVKILANIPALRRLGIVAYGVYMFHEGILGLAHGLILHQGPKIQTIQDLAITMLALVATVALAVLSWKSLEKPLVALGHRLQYQKPFTAPFATAQPTAKPGVF